MMLGWSFFRHDRQRFWNRTARPQLRRKTPPEESTDVKVNSPLAPSEQIGQIPARIPHVLR